MHGRMMDELTHEFSKSDTISATSLWSRGVVKASRSSRSSSCILRERISVWRGPGWWSISQSTSHRLPPTHPAASPSSCRAGTWGLLSWRRNPSSPGLKLRVTCSSADSLLRGSLLACPTCPTCPAERRAGSRINSTALLTVSAFTYAGSVHSQRQAPKKPETVLLINNH